MSDLSDLAADLTKDLPLSARKVIDKALENGWCLNAPGMTVALRLNHPTDDLALPVYITWVVGRTPKGAMSFRFDSCGTRGQVPLKPADLLEYLEDPTVAYTLAEEALKAAQDKSPPWDENKTPAENLREQTGARVIGYPKPERGSKTGKSAAEIMAASRAKWSKPSDSEARPAGRPLRIQAPGS
jgi:hypothetical protein